MILPSGPVPERDKGKRERILVISNMALLLKPSFIQQRESLNPTPGSQLHSQEEQENMALQGQKTDSGSKEVERKGTFHLGKVDSFLCCQLLCQGTDHDPSSFAGWPC